MRWYQIRIEEHDPATPITEAGTIKPSGSLDADALRKGSERRARVQQQIKDEESRHVAKVRDLKTRLTIPD
jgi:hypothetical protein